MRKRSSLFSSSLEGLVELINLQQTELKGVCIEGNWYNPKKDLYECIYSYYVKPSNIKQEDDKSNIQKKVKEIIDRPIDRSGLVINKNYI